MASPTEIKLISPLFNETLSEEWNFMPLSADVAKGFARDLTKHLDPTSILIAEANGEPVGLSIFRPDLNQLLAELKGFPRWLRLVRFV